MVGVPGKYKGCNTCRLRRIKCDNIRPLCRKCVEGGRKCGGYERETVFIIGTIEDGGRCSSHPPRMARKNHRGRNSPKEAGDEHDELDLLCHEPLRPAWDDLVFVSNQGARYYLQISALHVALHHVARSSDESIHTKTHLLHFPPYQPLTIRSGMHRGNFQLNAQCLIHLAPTEGSPRGSPRFNIVTESVCLFLYEHNWSHLVTDQGPWKEATADANTVRRLGPENFQTFPNHHFFVRLFRHNATCSALLNRKGTFLSSPEWLSTPWELHPKSAFDKLFDSLVLLPSLLARTDRLNATEPTVARRFLAQDLLGNCLHLNRMLAQWHDSASIQDDSQASVYWMGDLSNFEGQMPFEQTYVFTEGVTALSMIYYWAALVIFYPCLQKLYNMIGEPVLDSFSQVYPNASLELQTEATKYGPHEIREKAEHICRSFDFALATTVQPDILLFPLLVVQEFYRNIGYGGADGQLEAIWCDAFLTRLTQRGRDIADVVRAKRWYDMAQY